MSCRQVMLIRCRPDAAGASRVQERVLQWIRSGSSGLLFFHSAGVDWAMATPSSTAAQWRRGGMELMVCSAAWQRRYPEPPPQDWRLGSLIQFWDAADGAERVESFGALDRA